MLGSEMRRNCIFIDPILQRKKKIKMQNDCAEKLVMYLHF